MRATYYILIALLILGFSDVYACSCQGESTVKGAIKSSAFVIVGEIISRDFINIPDSIMIRQNFNDSLAHKFYPYVHRISKYKIQIEKVYKGKTVKDTMEIYTGNGGGDCGYRFKVGEKYIVYGVKENYFGMLNNDYDYSKGEECIWTNICMRTTNYDESEINEIENIIQ
ncbi:MAG: hypothetical protein R6U95_01270 [Bacteroidales bacterium]